MLKRALISVFDKEGIAEFAEFLVSQGVELISTGGTYKYLKEKGLKVTEVSEVTNFPEMLDGRVKTLHPNIHGGILAIRDNPVHMQTIAEHNIETIDMVIVNLYPFFNEVVKDISFEEKVEFIDIGGPTMLRSAAKAFKDVIVISDTIDYAQVQQELSATQDVSFATRKKLAGKVFNLTSAYDAAISNFLLGEDEFPHYLNISYQKSADLRYGENPHQKAAFYTATTQAGVLKDFVQLHGKELSFNNIRDMDLAWKVVAEFNEVAACGVKHSTPCGVAIGANVADAYAKMHASDPVSIFGGIVAINSEVDLATAKEMNNTFLEIVMAPAFSAEALTELQTKKNLRVIQIKTTVPQAKLEYVTVDGGILVQDRDCEFADELKVVTKAQPSAEDLIDLTMAMKVVKHVKSNAIVVAKNGVAKGIGAGQTNRIWATAQAIERAKDGGVLASDAFFPFRDCVDECAKAGIKAIIQPGGSLRDQESIDACDEHGIAMVFSGIRHFKH
ncbi:MAG TPA: bifunctional phosphoribosylaminoimidazolecarboxamide formyltransferase/IMP cyclohydrolase [Burkholderiales bacterium]|nr:bifunctional phosphoribosylaminoimidazolecarboxamide formyltransferase/IMP cyclohydrolase [Burkholderiales bacterium]